MSNIPHGFNDNGETDASRCYTGVTRYKYIQRYLEAKQERERAFFELVKEFPSTVKELKNSYYEK
jgi:hypothetical protein